MPDNRRISGETPFGNPEDNLEYVLAHGGQLKEDYPVKQKKVLQNAFIWPDGTEYQKGHVLPAGMVLPRGSIVKVSSVPKNEIEVPEENVVFTHKPEKKAGQQNLGAAKEELVGNDDSWAFGGNYYKVAPNISIIGCGGAAVTQFQE